jgi:phosphatidylserine/phosphatidylglycerophosphate/cardiolipin synthase-like enzyme
MYGTEQQMWHDQHLRLEGPVVATLEHVFCERWSDPAAAYLTLGPDTKKMPSGSIISSTENAIDRGRILHRTYTTDARHGTRTRAYYVGYGVTSSDVIAVRLSGREVSSDNYRITPQGLSFITSADGASGPPFDAPQPGLPLEIVYGSAQPKPLPDPQPVPEIITTAANIDSLANTQIWLTIANRGEARGAYEGGDTWATFRDSGVDASSFLGTVSDEAGTVVPVSPYRVGEFSNMAGIANACAQAREFIWIFDQYFWSRPYARLVAARLRAQPSLHVAIVLPPWSDLGEDSFGKTQHSLRYRALSVLGSADIKDRVAVYFPWYQVGSRNVGIYAHAKVQLFDDQLMVCGSCNLNERSFSVDSEVCCAVESLTVVQQHYRKLWEHFVSPFGGYPFPITFASGWGRSFYLQLFGALSFSGTHYLQFDEGGHVSNVTTLPNGAIRTAPLEGGLPDRDFETEVCEPYGLPLGLYSALDLQQIVDTIESHRAGVRSPRM